MKKLFLTIAFLAASLICFAQNQKVSVVELQNGTTIRGVILEAPQGTIKIKTADQSVFVYPESDVVKIIETNEVFRKNGLDNRGPQKGKYRGFAELGISQWIIGTGTSPIEIETSHGFQLLNWLFVGGGAGIHLRTPFSILDGFNEGYMDVIVPIFADVRVDFIDNSVTPFVDLRGGYEIAPSDIGNGVYLNPMVGCRVALSKFALNFSLGYTYRQIPNGVINQCAEVTIKAGIEF